MIVDLETVIDLLIAEGVIRGRALEITTKPSHGSCCTCQTCGWDYDNCVCDHNRILSAINSLAASTESELIKERDSLKAKLDEFTKRLCDYRDFVGADSGTVRLRQAQCMVDYVMDAFDYGVKKP